MPSAKKQDVNNKNIKDFFKPFTIPRNRIPVNDIIEEEIIVTQPTSSPSSNLRARTPSQSPRRRQNGFTISQSSQASSIAPSVGSTPTKRSTSETLTHVSPTGSQRRVMSAVEIPSPKPPAAKPEEASSALLNTSFSTVSTLSSLPVSTASSSRRITTKNGIQAITNSDSGSAESSSEDELADMSTFIPRKRVKLTPPEGQEHANDVPSTIKPATRRNARPSKSIEQLRGLDASGRSESPSSIAPAYKYSLAALVKQQQKDQDIAKRMTEMEQKSAAKGSQRDAERQTDRLVVPGLKAAVAEDSDEGERVMLAMQRTGALDGEEKFYFFGEIRDEVVDEVFPAATDGEPPWITKLRNEKWRIEACLSGFAAELASKKGVPESVQVWMTRQLLVETRDDLCDAYTSILENCPRRLPGSSQLVTALSTFYDVPCVALDGRPPERPHRLEYVLRIAQHFISLKQDHIHETLIHLIFGLVDVNVEQHASLRCAFEDCIENILGHALVSDPIVFRNTLERRFAQAELSTQIKCRAVAAMPARTEQGRTIRRILALRLVLDAEKDARNGEFLMYPISSYVYPGSLLSRLKSAPEFAISDKTDYHVLNPLIQVLDIAIGNGFRTLRRDDFSEPDPKRFNAQIDEFIDQLNVMASRIRDAGTTHLERTQAKSAIERLAKRLEYGVRTKPKHRKGIFSGGLAVDERQKDFLEGFLKAGDAKADAQKGVDQEAEILSATAVN